jgi:hypothetical protein
VDRETKAVQLYDRGHQAKAQSDSRRIPDLVGAVETPQYRLTLMLADAATGVGHPHDGFVIVTRQLYGDLAALRGKFDGVVDEVRDGLEQEIPVTSDVSPLPHLDPQLDILVFRDRLVEIAYLAQYFMPLDPAERR